MDEGDCFLVGSKTLCFNFEKQYILYTLKYAGVVGHYEFGIVYYIHLAY